MPLSTAEAKEVIGHLNSIPAFAWCAGYALQHNLRKPEIERRLVDLAAVRVQVQRYGFVGYEREILSAAFASPESPGNSAGVLFAALREHTQPVIQSHLPPNPRSAATAAFRRRT